MILFREMSSQFKGLYEFDETGETLNKIYGVGPRAIIHKMVAKFFKYFLLSSWFRIDFHCD